MSRARKTDLVPAAATAGAVIIRPADEARLSDEAVETFVKALGGRQALVDVLSLSDERTELQVFVTHLLDPRFDRYSVARLCRLAGLSVADFLRAFKKSQLVRAHIAATPVIVEKLVGVVVDVMTRAQPYAIPCPACGGIGQVTPEPSKDQPNPRPQPCEPCRGGGQLLALPDLDRQKLALELGGLLGKGSGHPLVALQQNFEGGAGQPTPGGFTEMQQALSQLLFAPPPRPIDVEPVDLDADDEDS